MKQKKEPNDMKRHRILRLSTACLVAATARAAGIACIMLLAAAACTQDELADGQGEPLPEGMYPLTFTATQTAPTASPQTRVTDTDGGGGSVSGSWTDGDKIAVRIGSGTETGTYTLNADGTVKTADKPVYWQTTAAQTVTAWYSNIANQSTVTENTVSFADQSSRLAYVLKATASNVAYNTTMPTLQFTHQLAKVRVKLNQDASYKGDLTNAIVKIKDAYTSCTIDKGTITSPGAKGSITMKKPATDDGYYEANIIPDGAQRQQDVFEITAEGKTATAGLNAVMSFGAGKVHTVTITVKQAPPIGDKKADDAEVGDYMFSDGTFASSVPAGQQDKVIGIVFAVGQSQYDASNYSNTGIGQEKCHGYVVALNDAKGAHCVWGKRKVKVDDAGLYPNGVINYSKPDQDWSGYDYTQRIIKKAGGKGGLNSGTEAGYPATYYAVVDYESNVKAAPSNTSGWFLPSIGQLQKVYQEQSSNLTGKIGYIGLKSDLYWSSSEDYYDPAEYALYLSVNGGNVETSLKYINRCCVRAVLAY